jgi:hypothetical protein
MNERLMVVMSFLGTTGHMPLVKVGHMLDDDMACVSR